MFQDFVTKHDTSVYAHRVGISGTDISVDDPSGAISIVNNGNIAAKATTCSFSTTIGSGKGSFIVAVKLDNTSPDDHHVVSCGVNLSLANVAYPIVGIVRFESASDQPTSVLGQDIQHFPVQLSVASGGTCSVRDCVTVRVKPDVEGNNVFAGVIVSSAKWNGGDIVGTVAINQVVHEQRVLQPLK